MTEGAQLQFSSSLPIIIYIRPQGEPEADWQELDRGPGYFTIPPGYDVRVRAKSINDQQLAELVKELAEVEPLRFLDLSENRNVTNEGLGRLRLLPKLTGLNLSSCSITNPGILHLKDLPKLETLDLSFCNRLSDPSLKTLESIRSLTFVDLRGCQGLTKAGLSRIRRKNFSYYR